MCFFPASVRITTWKVCGHLPRSGVEGLPALRRRFGPPHPALRATFPTSGEVISLNDLCVAVEDLAQLGRWLDAVFLHHLEQAQDVADTREMDALLPGQVLDDLDLADVALRIAAPVGDRAVRLDQTRVLIEHQRAGMCVQDLSRDADRVKRLVHV